MMYVVTVTAVEKKNITDNYPRKYLATTHWTLMNSNDIVLLYGKVCASWGNLNFYQRRQFFPSLCFLKFTHN